MNGAPAWVLAGVERVAQPRDTASGPQFLGDYRGGVTGVEHAEEQAVGASSGRAAHRECGGGEV